MRAKAAFALVARVFRHPLAITLLAGAFTAIFLPQLTRQWQDRQKERALKQSLLEQISTSSATAVTQGISFVKGQLIAAGGAPGQDGETVYAILRNSWIVHRASARSTIITYFPNVDSCWYSYERAVSDFISLSADNYAPNRRQRVKDIRRYVESDFAESYVEPGMTDEACAPLQELPPAIQDRFHVLEGVLDWESLIHPTTDQRFSRSVYAALGEALLIGGETIIRTIRSSDAEDFSHGIF